MYNVFTSVGVHFADVNPRFCDSCYFIAGAHVRLLLLTLEW